MKTLLTITALLAFAVPAATAQSTSPAQLCKEQLRTMGAAAFQSAYGSNGNGRNAMGKCVSRQRQVVSQSTENAAKKCKAERGATAASRAAFADKYGTNPNKRNAFGKCVSGQAKETTEAQQEATLNAAKTCKAERGTTAESRTAFQNKYGTNANKRNAFGKCVSQNAKKTA
jgi:Tfp pilus assembly protein PilV